MDFVGLLLTTSKGHDYLVVVVKRFSNMCILMPSKNTIKGQEAKTCSLIRFECTLGYQGESSQKGIYARFVSAFWNIVWEKMDTNLNRSTAFHL